MLKERPIAVAVGYSVLGVLPLFLVSAQAVQLQRELGFGTAGLGLAVSLCFAASAAAATAARAARRADRRGRGPARVGVALALARACAMALVASRWWHVALALGAVRPGQRDGADRRPTSRSRAACAPERQGVAFGAKQAAVPIASLGAGLALPVVGAAGGLARRVRRRGACSRDRAGAGRPRRAAARAASAARPRGRARPCSRSPSLVGLLGGAVGNAIPAFAVDSAVAHGCIESAARPAARGREPRRGARARRRRLGRRPARQRRLLRAARADRRRRRGAGRARAGGRQRRAVTCSPRSRCSRPAGAGRGCIYYATVRSHRATPGAATGFVLSWIYVGNVLGPATVGLHRRAPLVRGRVGACAAVLCCGPRGARGAGRLDQAPAAASAEPAGGARRSARPGS